MSVRLHWGIGISIVYALFASGTLAFTWFALHQPVELVAADYYERALSHDRVQAAAARGTAIESSIAISSDGEGRNMVVVWTDAGTRPHQGTATFYRPSNPAWDRRIAIAPDPDGRQMFAVADLAAGHWILQLRWTAGSDEYAIDRAVTLR
jgi:nitrogen fixation protein FixH